MNLKYIIIGVVLFLAGLGMYINVRGRKPFSETNPTGQLPGDYFRFKSSAIMAMVVGIILILTSL